MHARFYSIEACHGSQRPQHVLSHSHSRVKVFTGVWLQKTLESPLDCKEIKPVNPKGNQPWIFIRRTDAETSALWPPDVKSQLVGKNLDDGKIEGRRRKRKQKMSWLDIIMDSMNTRLSKPWETVKDKEGWRATVHGVAKSQTRLTGQHEYRRAEIRPTLFLFHFLGHTWPPGNVRKKEGAWLSAGLSPKQL